MSYDKKDMEIMFALELIRANKTIDELAECLDTVSKEEAFNKSLRFIDSLKEDV